MLDMYDGYDDITVYAHPGPKFNIYNYGYKHLACKDPNIKRTDKEYNNHLLTINMYFNMPSFNKNNGLRFLYKLLQTVFRDFPYNNIECMEIIDGTSNIFTPNIKYEKSITYSYEEAMSYKNYKDFCKAVMSSLQKDDIFNILCKKDINQQQ